MSFYGSYVYMVIDGAFHKLREIAIKFTPLPPLCAWIQPCCYLYFYILFKKNQIGEEKKFWLNTDSIYFLHNCWVAHHVIKMHACSRRKQIEWKGAWVHVLCVAFEWFFLNYILIIGGSYNVRSIKILQSWISSRERAKFWRWEMVAGIVTGFSTSLITISLIRLIHQMKSWLPHLCAPRLLPQAVNTVHLKRAGFLVVYFSVVIWLAMQYGKRLGLPEIFTALNS